MAVDKMSEAEIIKIYNEGINSVISLVKDMNSQILSLKEQVNILNNRITELEVRVNKNSKNSSNPPSSDGLKKPKNMRENTGKRTGGQPGHEGKTLNKAENPDEIIDIKQDKCDCGCSLSDVEGTISSRQVVEMPKIKLIVTEFRAYEKVCPDCKKVHKSEFPVNVTQPVQYGENMQAFVTYLTNYQLLPLNRATEIINDLTDQKISEGTLVNINDRLHKKLEVAETSITCTTLSKGGLVSPWGNKK